MGGLFGGVSTPEPQKIAPAATNVSGFNQEADMAKEDMLKKRRQMAGFASTQLSNRDNDTLGR